MLMALEQGKEAPVARSSFARPSSLCPCLSLYISLYLCPVSLCTHCCPSPFLHVSVCLTPSLRQFLSAHLRSGQDKRPGATAALPASSPSHHTVFRLSLVGQGV